MTKPEDKQREPTDSAKGDREASGWDIARWVVAAIIAVAGAVFYFHALADQSICRQELAGGGGSTVVQVCGPPRLLDLAPFALVIAVALWPDLGELAVAGLFTLRRRVARQEERQGAVEQRLGGIDQQLMQIATLSQMQGQNQTQTFNLVVPDQGELKRSIDLKEGAAGGTALAGLGSAEELAAAKSSSRAETDERLRLLGKFVRDYARLEPYMVSPRSPLYRRIEADIDPDRRQLVKDWYEMFEPEITALRQTRNATIHQPDLVSQETLRGAIDNTAELSRIVFDRIG
jgi:hypothetical protein